ncbi:hypothetical protein ACHAXN_008372 [Cyclotella atomus]
MHLISAIAPVVLTTAPTLGFIFPPSPQINLARTKSCMSTNGEDFDPLLSPHSYPNGVDNGAVSDESQMEEENSGISFGFGSIEFQETSSVSRSGLRTSHDDFDPTLSPHSYPDGVDAGAVLEQHGKLGILLIDHGSKREASNEHLHYLAQIYQYQHNEGKDGEDAVVRGAHMEIATPSILTSLRELITVDQVTKIVCVPYFLSPGRHATSDIPNLIEDAKSVLSEEGVMMLSSERMVDIIVSDALGTHTESMLGAVDKLVDLALDRHKVWRTSKRGTVKNKYSLVEITRFKTVYHPYFKTQQLKQTLIIFILATVQANNNLRVPIASNECTIQAIEVLKNPSESPIAGGDLEYGCDDRNGLLSPLHLDEVQQKSLPSLTASGQVQFGKSKVNVNEATFNLDGSITVPSGKPLLSETRENNETALGRRTRPKANKRHFYLLFRATDEDGRVPPHSPEVMSDNVSGPEETK